VGWEAISRESVENLESSVEAENLAYVLYTSGSTGQPKAVELRHAGLSNFLNSMRIEPGFCDRDVLLAVTTICFDIAWLELFLPLVTGGRVVIASRETASDGALLLGLIQSSGATTMQATPATWRMLLAAGWRGSSGLKILCGGEALPRELATELLERGRSVWNLYGPTETTIWSALGRIEAGARIAAIEPIGRPIANTLLYVLDEFLQPVPPGVIGDLYIGGEGVARGYLRRPALTAERFLPNPFDSGGSRRMYQSGDIARYLPDGTIELLGRRDHQVKIRGYRIELGEIEAVLATHSAVREVAIVARTEEFGAKHLVAYVVPRKGTSFSASEMRSHLVETMPDYMVPSICVLLEALPLTPNGKIDRLALPLSAGAVPAPLASAHVAPRDTVEQAIAALWQEVLNVETLGVYDDFFALGGHSLRAAKVIASVKRDFGLSLTLREFFASPTIAQLAGLARSKQLKDPVLKRAGRIGRAKPLVVDHDGLPQAEWMQLQ
jgi:amino acid adenylation domain-containing protein